MSLTREDVLRELELLPVWRQRAVAPQSVTEIQTPEMPNTQTQEPQELQPALRMILSDDAHFLFLLEALKSAEEETLLQNMLKAMVNIGMAKPRVDTRLQRISDISAQPAKIIIAMGDAATQAMDLNANIRGEVQLTSFGAAITTFSPAHLLANTADKAQAWQDLCLALQAAQGLQSA